MVPLTDSQLDLLNIVDKLGSVKVPRCLMDAKILVVYGYARMEGNNPNFCTLRRS